MTRKFNYFSNGVVFVLLSTVCPSLSDSCEDKSDNTASVNSQLTIMYQMVDRLRQRMIRLEERQKQLEEHLTKVTSSVAFSAYMDNGYFFPAAEQIIPFTGIVANFGNHYNRTTSIFTFPVRGVYEFKFNLYTGVLSPNTKIRTSGELMLDTFKLAETYCYNENEHSVEMNCGNSVISECNEGGKVWVQSEYTDCSIFGSPDKETTFSGYLLNAL